MLFDLALWLAELIGLAGSDKDSKSATPQTEPHELYRLGHAPGMSYTRYGEHWTRFSDGFTKDSGSDRRVEHIAVDTTAERDTAAFLYRFRLDPAAWDIRRFKLVPGSPRIWHFRLVVATRLPVEMPLLDIRMRGRGDREYYDGARRVKVGGRAVGRRYRVFARHERFAHDLLTPQTLDWLMSLEWRTRCPLTVNGRWLYSMDRRMRKWYDIDARVRVVRALAGQIASRYLR